MDAIGWKKNQASCNGIFAISRYALLKHQQKKQVLYSFYFKAPSKKTDFLDSYRFKAPNHTGQLRFIASQKVDIICNISCYFNTKQVIR